MQQNFAKVEPPIDLPIQDLHGQEALRVPELLPPSHKKVRKKRGTQHSVPVALLKTGAYGSMGLALSSIGMSVLFFCLVTGSALWEIYFPNHDSHWNLPLWQCALNAIMMLSPIIVGACLFFGVGRGANKWAGKLDEQLTLQAAADLPLSESLLRASAEPLHEQRAVLLRAARESPERHAADLLRPTEG